MSISFVERKLEIEAPAEVACNVDYAPIVVCTLEFIVKANSFVSEWFMGTNNKDIALSAFDVLVLSIMGWYCIFE